MINNQNTNVTITRIDYINPSNKPEIDAHILKFRDCLEEINRASNSYENIQDTILHVANIATRVGDATSLIAKPSPRHYPNVHPDLQDLDDWVLSKQDVWNSNLNGLDRGALGESLRNELANSQGYASGFSSNLAINEVSDYATVVERIASTFGRNGYQEASILFELTNFINNAYLFSCVQHKFVMAIGIGLFSQNVYWWCFHSTGFQVLMRDVVNVIYKKYVPFRNKILNIGWNYRIPIVLSSLTFFNSTIWPFAGFRRTTPPLTIVSPFFQAICSKTYVGFYHAGTLIKSATQGLYDSLYKERVETLLKKIKDWKR